MYTIHTQTQFDVYVHSTYFLQYLTIVGAAFTVTMNEIGEVAEGDTVNFTCTLEGTTSPNISYFLVNYIPLFNFFFNSTSNPVIEYDNTTKNYTTTFTVLNVPVDRRFNYQILYCGSGLSFKGKTLIVYCKSKFWASFLKKLTTNHQLNE